MLRRIALLVLVGGILVHAGATVAQAAGEQEPGLNGLYMCTGTSPGGEEYRGLVEIVKQGDTFQILWTFSPDNIALGVGILRDRVLAVSYYGQAAGVVLYRLQDDGSLVGDWTVLGGDGRVFVEKLAKMAAGERPVPSPERRKGRRPTGRIVPSME